MLSTLQGRSSAEVSQRKRTWGRPCGEAETHTTQGCWREGGKRKRRLRGKSTRWTGDSRLLGSVQRAQVDKVVGSSQ